jgi:intron-binding protein aquarius
MENKDRNDGSSNKNNENKTPLTVDQINSDRITQVSNLLHQNLHNLTHFLQVASKYWAPQTCGNHMDFDASIVDQIYHQEVQGAKFMIRRIMMLEFSQYLENYLWPNYKPDNSSVPHVLSIVIMVNEKFRERVSAWQVCVSFVIQIIC